MWAPLFINYGLPIDDWAARSRKQGFPKDSWAHTAWLTGFAVGHLSRWIPVSSTGRLARPARAVRQPGKRVTDPPVPARDASCCRSRPFASRQCTLIPPTNRQRMIKKA